MMHGEAEWLHEDRTGGPHADGPTVQLLSDEVFSTGEGVVRCAEAVGGSVWTCNDRGQVTVHEVTKRCASTVRVGEAWCVHFTGDAVWVGLANGAVVVVSADRPHHVVHTCTRGHPSGVLSLCHGGAHTFSGSAGVVLQWGEGYRCVRDFAIVGLLRTMAFASGMVCAGLESGAIHRWCSLEGTLVSTAAVHRGEVTSFAVPDDLWSGGMDGMVAVGGKASVRIGAPVCSMVCVGNHVWVSAMSGVFSLCKAAKCIEGKLADAPFTLCPLYKSVLACVWAHRSPAMHLWKAEDRVGITNRGVASEWEGEYFGLVERVSAADEVVSHEVREARAALEAEERREEELESMRKEVVALQQHYDAELQELREKLAATERLLAAKTEYADQLQSRLHDRAGESEFTSNKVSAMTTEIDTLRANLDDAVRHSKIQMQRDQARVEYAERMLQERTFQLEEAKRKCADLKAQCQVSVREVARLQGQVDDHEMLLKRLAVADARAAALTEEKAKRETLIESQKKELQTAKRWLAKARQEARVPQLTNKGQLYDIVAAESEFLMKSRSELISQLWDLFQDLSKGIGMLRKDPATTLLDAAKRRGRWIISNYLTEVEKLHLGIPLAHFPPDDDHPTGPQQHTPSPHPPQSPHDEGSRQPSPHTPHATGSSSNGGGAGVDFVDQLRTLSHERRPSRTADARRRAAAAKRCDMEYLPLGSAASASLTSPYPRDGSPRQG
eukprot:Sspe_Gene.46179::Locus_23002_Transcript_1_7_Confidence_0.222_Length_2517::g.46179::m.46179